VSRTTDEDAIQGTSGTGGAGGAGGDTISDAELSRPSTAEKKKDGVRIQLPGDDGSPLKVEPGEDLDDEDKLDHRKRKRNRTIRSCVPCHNHKRKVGSG
jgi:hypothetical protein